MFDFKGLKPERIRFRTKLFTMFGTETKILVEKKNFNPKRNGSGKKVPVPVVQCRYWTKKETVTSRDDWESKIAVSK